MVGQPVRLTHEQRRWLSRLYDTPTRTFILSMGRKGGKTSLSAMLLLLHLIGPEAKRNSQLFSAAQSRDQAAILFALAAKMVRMHPDLEAYVTIRDTAKQLHCPDLGTLYRALSAEASTSYGLSPAFVVHDELGQVRGPRSELFEALETAAGAQQEPLSVIISTQAPTDGDLLSLLIDDARKGKDPLTKLELYTAPEDLDPFSEEAIRAANPHYDDLMNKEEVKRLAKSAKRMPTREQAYRNLVLNQRIDVHIPFVSRSVWDSCKAEPVGWGQHPVYAGLDLSARTDLTALALAWWDGEAWSVRCEFFSPADTLLDRAAVDRAPYDVWARDGYITTTPGSSVDYAVVAERLKDLSEQVDLRLVAFDRWRIDVFKRELERIGCDVPMQPFGQGFKDMAPALDTLETELLQGRMRHGGNPVLRWCAANAVVSRDPAGGRKFDKAKVTGRIDGIVALAMAIGVAQMPQHEQESGPSVYESRGVLVL